MKQPCMTLTADKKIELLKYAVNLVLASPSKEPATYEVSIAEKHKEPTIVVVQAESAPEAEEKALALPEIREKYRDIWSPLISSRISPPPSRI
ncbi:MAG: hypothetical protein JW893_07920 [Candidatus Omnitrophica bacterium]|nr:hypothetical protein [Candidatus Omnitrophota bacterium]